MAEICIIGLDPGTAHTGYACLYGDTEIGNPHLSFFGVLKTKKTDGEVRERIDILGTELRKLASYHKTTHLAVEDFTEQGKLVGKTYKEMSWLTEHFRMVGRELGLVTDIYENGVWKKTLLKAARANKAQVQHFVSHRLPETTELLKGQPDHVWDAVAIALCTFHNLLKLNGGKHHGKLPIQGRTTGRATRTHLP